MTINELIKKLKFAASKFGEDALVDVCNDEPGTDGIGIYFLKEVGRANREDWKAAGFKKWDKIAKQFGATASMNSGKETVFYAKIDEPGATIILQ